MIDSSTSQTVPFSQTALSRYQMIRPFLEDAIPLAQLAKFHHVSERTLRRWVVRYQQQGLAGLERQRRADRGSRRKVPGEMMELIKAYALQKPPLPITVIHRRITAYANQHASPPPSYSLVYDIVRQIDPALLTLAHEGSKAYREKYELIYRREASAPNEMWQADHTPLDIVLLDAKQQPQRPWLTTIIDDYSRALCGYFLSFGAPNAVNTALALRQAIWHKSDPRWRVCGIPQLLYVDNGSDFTSEHIEQACIHLKIRCVHSPPGMPRGRGRVERLFLTINERLLVELPGYVSGGHPANPPTLSMSEFSELFEQFLHDVYHPQPHSATGEPPLQRWQAGAFLPNMPDSLEELSLLLLRVSKPRKVQRDGIRFQSFRYMESTLAAFVGEEVEIRYDPRDLAEIQVYHQGEFVCRAVCQAIASQQLSLQEIRQARNQRRTSLRQELKSARNIADIATGKQAPLSTPKPRRQLKLYHHD